MTAPASTSCSSSSFHYGWTYDVFLSFRGLDTRYGFTGFLYKALCDKGIHTFVDDKELESGDEITPALVKAIQESRIAIVVLSNNYASSSFCLDELFNIRESIHMKGRLVLPVFYKVDPSTVRHQRDSYGKALAKHEERFKDNTEKVQNWRKALHQVANLAGWHLEHGDRYEYEFVGRIVEVVSSKITCVPLHVADYPVGLESRVWEVTSCLDIGSDDGVHMVGIYGIGGMGKTTLARAVYNLIADQFAGLCFLDNVREISIKHGIKYLQETLLSKIVGLDIKLGDVNEGISIIKHRLHRKKVLLVLDDVDKIKQLQAIAGGLDWFGSGSRVIITTQDKHLLTNHRVEKKYEVEELNEKDALELLGWSAFKSDKIDLSYVDILNNVVTYASGLPLALEVIGSNLFGKSIKEWKSALDQCKRIPIQEIQQILKVSFDALEEWQQEIFLDIACCFEGYQLAEVEDILHAHHGVCMKYGIGVLVEKSLMKIESGCVRLHDLIEDMGKEIVRQKSMKEPGKCSRLWLPEDIVEVLGGNKGTADIEIICMDCPKFEEVVNWNGKAFKKMTNLRTLIIRSGRFSRGPKHLPDSLRVLEWWGYPSRSLPFDFYPKKLVIFKLLYSGFTSLRLLNMPKKFVNMRVLDFSYSNCITQIPDVSGFPNLEELSFKYCQKLTKIHDSVGLLDKLRFLIGDHCSKLRSFPPIKLTSLEELSLFGCSSLENFPEVLGKMENIERLWFWSTRIKELPSSIQNLTGFQSVESESCGIVRLPKQEGEEEISSVWSPCILILLGDCNITDESLQISLAWVANVVTLDLSNNDFTILPAYIKELHFLTTLYLDHCKNLREIRGIPPNLFRLSACGCTSLKDLDLTLHPAYAKKCHSLTELVLSDCENLQEIEGLSPNITLFIAANCRSLTSLCRSKLLNEQLHEGDSRNYTFLLPGPTIPEWFEYCSREPSISFWFRNKIPVISLCLISASRHPFSFSQCSINGRLLDHPFLFYRYLESGKDDHLIILRPNLSFVYCDDEVPLENEWNHVLFCFGDCVKEIGLHVFKSKNRMEDIQFTDPLVLKEKHEVDTEISQIQFLHPQKNLASLEQLEQLSRDLTTGKTSMPWNPEHQCISHNQSIVGDKSCHVMGSDQRSSQWQFSFCDLISSVVSFCCSSSSLFDR